MPVATIIKKIVIGILLLITTGYSLAHTIYAPNDIPLLDNRFRIDPYTEKITFILNHSQGRELVVLVRPDGSKLYEKNHPKNVSWITTNKVDMVTIENPMAGPWQAVAKLDGDNRIKLISQVNLEINKLPLKLYTKEYITTHASLYLDNHIMTDKNYLNGAKLSVVLIGNNNSQFSLYKDDGKNYDALPFDGNLTAHIFVNTLPGRYLLSIRTKNEVFMRNINKDAVVFPYPISYTFKQREYGSDEAEFTFKIDSEELDPKSVSIDGIIKDENNNVVTQLLVHGMENLSKPDTLTKIQKVDYGDFTLSGKVFATTQSGREIELQLSELKFWLRKKAIMPTIVISDALSTESAEMADDVPIWKNIWVIIPLAISGLLMLIGGVYFMIRIRRKKALADANPEFSLDELTKTDLQSDSTKSK